MKEWENSVKSPELKRPQALGKQGQRGKAAQLVIAKFYGKP